MTEEQKDAFAPVAQAAQTPPGTDGETTEISFPDAPAPEEEDGEDEEDHTHHRRRLRRKAFPDPVELDPARLLELMLFEVMPRCDTSGTALDLLERCGGVSGVLDRENAALPPAGDAVGAYLRVLGAAVRRVDHYEDPDCSTFYSLRAAREWFRCRPWERKFPTARMFVLTPSLETQLMHVFDLRETPLSQIAEFFTRDVSSEDSGYLFLSVGHPGGFLAPSREEVSALLALSAACIKKRVYFADAVLQSEDGDACLSESRVFPAGTFLDFRLTPDMGVPHADFVQ